MKREETIQFKMIQDLIELDLGMIEMLELLGGEFEIVMINMEKVLLGKVDYMRGEVDIRSRDVVIVKKKILEKNNLIIEMKNVFNNFISRFDIVEERVSEFENGERFMEIT